MSPVPAFPCATDAMAMVRAGLRFLAAADATQMPMQTQAECLQMLEQADAISTAARASVLSAFTTGQGYSADADYSARAWLINRTRITKGAAVAHTAWVRRAAAHPLIVQALPRWRYRSRALAPCGSGPTSSPRTAVLAPTRSWSALRGPGWTCEAWLNWLARWPPGPGPILPTAIRTANSTTARYGWRPPSAAREL